MHFLREDLPLVSYWRKAVFSKIIFASAVLAAPLSALAQNQTFNPDISLILDGRYSAYLDSDDYELPGFMLDGEVGVGEQGFSLGHTELLMSANIDDMYFGKMTAALHSGDEGTEVELEEAYIETLSLGKGATVKAGRFFSSIGYLNPQHPHSWDFVDAPLVYQGMFGGTLMDDGVQLRWVAPTDLFVQLSAELGRGGHFPAGGAANEGSGTQGLFVELGGDLGASHSWQLGFSHWQADIAERSGGGHGHGDEEGAEVPVFSGDSRVSGVDMVWKWAPKGNSRETNLTFQFEYFQRDEQGLVELQGAETPEISDYQGKQQGWYSQLVYQFMPQWRVGARYDRLATNNRGADMEVLAEAGLDGEGHTPQRYSVMVDYDRSEFSRLRLQFNRDESSGRRDDYLILQYVMSLGSHGAHSF